MKKVITKRHEVIINDQKYILNLSFKQMKSMVLRFNSETGEYRVSVPYRTSLTTIEHFFLKHHPKLIKKQRETISPFGEQTFVFGQILDKNELITTYGLNEELCNIDIFYQIMNKTLLNYLTRRVRYYEQVMNIPLTYKIRVRNMKTRWGTNSLKTNTLSFASALIHFDHKTIDALIVHELAHYYHHGHNKVFYNYLEQIYPRYKYYDKKLKERTYG